jgi:hypothetical protein
MSWECILAGRLQNKTYWQKGQQRAILNFSTMTGQKQANKQQQKTKTLKWVVQSTVISNACRVRWNHNDLLKFYNTSLL